jgi:hypothetical protein
MLSPAPRERVELAERVAEGQAGPDEREKGRDMALQAGWLMDNAFIHRRGPANVAVCDALGRSPYKAACDTARRTTWIVSDQCDLLRDILGPLPFRPVTIPPAVLAWDNGCVVKLAAGIDEERDFSQERTGVLADALEEAGVTDQEILGHLRGPGPHIRGCHVVDLLLARE